MLPRHPLARRTFVRGAALALTAASYGRVRGANDRVGVGFVGYGLIGKRHALDFKEQPDVTPVAAAEVHRQHGTAVRRRPPGRRPGPGPGDRPAALLDQPAEDRSGDSRQQLQEHVRNFLDCVKSRGRPVSDLESGHRTATACHLANLALRLGRRVRWDAEREEVVGDPEASRLLARPYRPPWDAELWALL